MCAEGYMPRNAAEMIKCLETRRREITLFNLAYALGYLWGFDMPSQIRWDKYVLNPPPPIPQLFQFEVGMQSSPIAFH